MLLSILTIIPSPSFLLLFLLATLPPILSSLYIRLSTPPRKTLKAITANINKVEHDLKLAKMGGKTNVSGTFVAVSKTERSLISLNKARETEVAKIGVAVARAEKVAKYLEMGALAVLFAVTWDTHLCTIGDLDLDAVKKHSYWKSVTFPASTYVQMLPGWFAKEAEELEGLGGSVGGMAVGYAAYKSVKRIVKVMSWEG